MTVQNFSPFCVIGIAIQTTNENDQSVTDIPQLWSRFMSEGIIEKIPGKIDNTLFCVYTDYEQDHTRPYTALLGCKVKSLTNIPENMVGKMVAGGNYTEHTAKGNLQQGIVFTEWVKIWNSNIERRYSSDFEVYVKKAQDIINAEVDIFIAVK